MPSVFIVEDNALLAGTMVRFLSDHGKLHVAGVASSAEIALEKLNLVKVDLVLVDVALPAMSGIDLIALLRKQFPELPCLILSAHNESTYVRRALAAGARGYVIKSDPAAILLAIQDILAGGTYISEELQKKLYH